VHADDRGAFGTLLRRFRAEAGLSQEALAERARVSRRGIADLERGARRFPFGETVRRLADALDLASQDRTKLLVAAQKESPETHAAAQRLPLELASLVGREAELVELQAEMSTTRILTLTGPGGIGKTRLAQQLGRQVELEYADGAAFVDLAPVRDPTLLAQGLAHAVGVREQASKPLVDTLQRHLSSRHLLLIVDNCEHLLESVARLIDTLARNCSRVHILATSREPLRVRGERVWTVPPLTIDNAARLFVERAAAAQPAAPLGDDSTSRITGICERLDGIPLAIELAAVRVPAIGLDQIAARLEHRLRLLSSGNRLDAPRHQTLRAAIDWSYDLLSEPEQQLFERLAVFAGGWSLEAVEAVCGGWQPIASFDVLDLLANLVNRSLVVAEVQAGRTRYRLLEVIHEYAWERLTASGRAEESRQRLAAYYTELASVGATIRLGLNYAADMDALGRDHANLRAALAGLLTHDETDAAFRLCQALCGFWIAQGHLNEADESLARLLASVGDRRSPVFAGTLHMAGRVAEYRGEYNRAGGLLELSLAVARELEAPSLAARALNGLGDVALHQGLLEQAAGFFEEALACARRADSWPDIAQSLLAAGRTADARGQTGASRRLLEESLNIQRRLGDDWGVAYVLNELGQRAYRDGQLVQAHAWHDESYLLWRKTGSRMGQRAALMNLSLVNLAGGDQARTIPFVMATLDICQEMDDGSATTARCVEIASAVLRAFGTSAAAVVLIASAAARRAALGAPVPANEPEQPRTLSLARQELGEAAYQRAWEDGSRLSMRQAVALAGASLAALGPAASR
jgi:predicted ATPase/DNA-binding XRE family transcriptional regulator